MTLAEEEKPESRGYPSLWNAFTRAEIPLFFIVSSVLAAFACAIFTYIMRYNAGDDALIYFRYIKNAIDGKGLVYNEGEYYNAMTSPLYMYISIAVAAITRDVTASQHVLGGVFLFLASQTVLLLYHDRWPRIALFAVPFMILSCRFFYSTFGMETPLFIFLCIFAVWLYKERFYFALAITAALLLLARGEGLFLVLILIAFHFIERRPFPPLRVFVIPAMILAANYLFNYMYYGHFLPSTLMAKVHHGQSGLYPRWQFLMVGNTIRGTWNSEPLLMGALFFMAWLGLFGSRRDKPAGILILYTFVYSLFFVALSIPKFHWYYGIHFLVFFALVGLGMSELQRMALLQNRPAARRAVALLFVVFSVFVLARQTAHTWAYAGVMDEKSALSREIGFWIDTNTPKDASIATCEIGYVGWYSRRYIVDILGLISPPNAELLGKGDLEGWLKEYEPDYILAHDPLWPVETGVRPYLEQGTYYPVRSFPYPGFVLFERNPHIKNDKE